MTLTKSVWRMCGRLVGGVGPKMKTCYLLRVKQSFAFCCPLWPTKISPCFDALEPCRGYSLSPVTRVKPRSPHICAEHVRKNASTVTLAEKFLCDRLSETSDMVCVVVAAWNSLNQQGECLCHHRIYSPRWFIDFDQLFLLLRRRL